MSFPKVFSSMSIPSFAKTDLRSLIEILPLLSKGKKGHTEGERLTYEQFFND